MGLNKQYIKYAYKGKVILVASVHDGTTKEFQEEKVKADDNLKVLIAKFEKRIADLEKEVKILKGED